MVELTVLSVPDCPHAQLMTERLSQVLADHPGVRLVQHVARDEADAARLGMHGSPTLLIDGADPFAAPGTPVSVSCRIYRDETGRAEGAPSLSALRAALRPAAGPAAAPHGTDGRTLWRACTQPVSCGWTPPPRSAPPIPISAPAVTCRQP